MSPLILCPKCDLYVTPTTAMEYWKNHNKNTGTTLRNVKPSALVCEGCGWKLNNTIKKAQEANTKRSNL